jgi:hypothetical protein
LVGDYWKGDESDCSIGNHSSVDRDDALRRIKFFRYMVGLSMDVTINSVFDQECGEAAAYLFANSLLTHYPESNKPCFTQLAYQAASSSNIGMGMNAAQAIRLYVADDGNNNLNTLGHRRWILLPSIIEFGIGQKKNFNVLKVINTARNNSLTATFVAHPGPGPQFFDLVPRAWSFQMSSISGNNISVVLKRADGVNVDIITNLLPRGYGWDCISFMPTDKSQIKTGYEYKVNITIENNNYEYTTYFVNYDPTLKDTEAPELETFDDNSNKNNNKKKISKGAVAGIIIGVVFGCILIAVVVVVIVFVVRRRKNRSKSSSKHKSLFIID